VPVKSFGRNKKKYDVDLTQQTCTCPDFIDVRSSYGSGDVRKFCKHLVKVIIENDGIGQASLPAQFLLNSAYDRRAGTFLDDMKISNLNGSDILIGKSPNGEWFSVYTRNRKRGAKEGAYRRFGYNYFEERWSHGYAPPYAKVIKQVVSEFK